MYDNNPSTVTRFTGYIEVHRFRADLSQIAWVNIIDLIKLNEQDTSTFTLKDV